MNDLNLFKSHDSIYLKEVSKKEDISKDDDCEGHLIRADENLARKIIDSLKNSGKRIALCGMEDSFNRRAVEKLKINYLVSPEAGDKKDSLKQRDSGLNHVVVREAVKKGESFQDQGQH